MKTHPALAAIVLGLVGCTETTAISLGDNVASSGADGSIRLEVNSETSVYLYEERRGYEVDGVACDGTDDGLTVSDPSIVALEDRREREYVGSDGPKPNAMAYDISGLRIGDTTVEARCNGRVTTRAVHVVAKMP